jgi:hypothetical protein
MLQRVMPELMGMKNIVVLNDEAHHCYRATGTHLGCHLGQPDRRLHCFDLAKERPDALKRMVTPVP